MPVQAFPEVVMKNICVIAPTLREFSESQWKEAILWYLSAVRDEQHVVRCPCIIFGNVTLKLEPYGDTYEYNVYGENRREPPGAPIILDREKLRVDVLKQADVEEALDRFVNDEQIQLLQFWFWDSAVRFSLWKWGADNYNYGTASRY